MIILKPEDERVESTPYPQPPYPHDDVVRRTTALTCSPPWSAPQAPLLPRAQVYDFSQSPHATPNTSQSTEAGSKRRTRWLCSLLLICVAVVLFVPVQLRRVGHDSLRFLKDTFSVHDDEHEKYRIDTPNNCIQYANWSVIASTDPQAARPYAATAAFELPLSTDELYFQAHGAPYPAFIRGAIEFTDSGDVGSDVIAVELTAVYDSPEHLQLTQTCWMQPHHQSSRVLNGVAIFGPGKWRGPSLRLNGRNGAVPSVDFTIRVRFPRPAEGALSLEALHTHLPHFAHHVGDLQDLVTWTSFSLRSQDAPISVDSLSSKWASFRTDNGALSGNFQVSRGLHMYVGHSPLDVNATLVDMGLSWQPPTSLWMENEQHEMNATITLTTTRADGTGGAFDVRAAGLRSALALAVPAGPPGAVLTLDAHTAHAPVRAAVHRAFAFAGAVVLSQTDCRAGAAPALVVDTRAADPARRGRERVVDVRRDNGTVVGVVAWVPEEADEVARRRGSIRLSTTGAPAELVL